MSEKRIARAYTGAELYIPESLSQRITFALGINRLQRKCGLLIILSVNCFSKKQKQYQSDRYIKPVVQIMEFKR